MGGYIEAWEANIARHDAALADIRDLRADLVVRVLLRVLDDHGPNGYGTCPTCSRDGLPEPWPCPTWLAASGQDAS